MKALLVVAALSLALAVGCSTSTIGQVVTNVTPDGHGGVLVERATVTVKTCPCGSVRSIALTDAQTTDVLLTPK